MQALPVLFAAVLALGVGESSAGVHDPVVVSLAVRRVRADQAPLTARRQACQHQGAPARLADHCDSKPARACHRAQVGRSHPCQPPRREPGSIANCIADSFGGGKVPGSVSAANTRSGEALMAPTAVSV